MDRTQASAGQHGDRRLRHHRQVDHHPVATRHAERRQRAGELRGAGLHLAIGEGLDPPGHRAVPDQRRLLAAAGQHVAVNAVEAGVQHRTREPSAIRSARGIEYAVPASIPGDALGDAGPPGLWVGAPGGIGFGISGRGHGVVHRGLLDQMFA